MIYSEKKKNGDFYKSMIFKSICKDKILVGNIVKYHLSLGNLKKYVYFLVLYGDNTLLLNQKKTQKLSICSYYLEHLYR